MGKWIVLGIFVLSFGKIVSAEPYHVVLTEVVGRMMSGVSQNQEDGLLISRDRFAPWCKGKQLILNFFMKDTLSKQYVVELKEGSFLQSSVFIRDWTSCCIEEEQKKKSQELKRRKSNYSKISLKQRQEELFERELREEKRQIQEGYGVGACMARSCGNSFPLNVGGRVIFFQCDARIGGRVVRFQVDLSLFCDLDAWIVIGEDMWQEAEPYFTGVDVRDVMPV